MDEMRAKAQAILRLSIDDIERLRNLLSCVAKRDATLRKAIPALTITSEEDFWLSLQDIELDFVGPPENFLEQSDAFLIDGNKCIHLIIPMWDEFGKTDYSMIVEVDISCNPHIIDVNSIHVL